MILHLLGCVEYRIGVELMFSGAKDGVGSFNRVVRQGDNNEN